VEKMVMFESLKEALEWIEKNDNERIFGYQIVCNTDYIPIKWEIQIKSVINSEMQWAYI
jgi:hypothetical protein